MNGVQRLSLGPLWALHALTYVNHFKLIDVTTGKHSVKSQLTTHHSYKAMVTEWHTCGFGRVRKSCYKKKICHSLRKYRLEFVSALD